MISGKGIKIELQANGKIRISLKDMSAFIRRHKNQYLWTAGKTEMGSDWELVTRLTSNVTLVHKATLDVISNHTHTVNVSNFGNAESTKTYDLERNEITSARNYVYGISAELRDFTTKDGVESKWFLLDSPIENDLVENPDILTGATVTFAVTGSGLSNGEPRSHTHEIGLSTRQQYTSTNPTGSFANPSPTDTFSEDRSGLNSNYSAGQRAKLWLYLGETKWDTPKDGEYRMVGSGWNPSRNWNIQINDYLSNGALLRGDSDTYDTFYDGSVPRHFHTWSTHPLRTSQGTGSRVLTIGDSLLTSSATGGSYNKPFALIKQLFVYGDPVLATQMKKPT